MKKIIYYITDHGKGHATRSLAIIKELQKSQFEVIIRNSNAKKMIEYEIPNAKIIPGITDVGPVINKDGMSIDEKKSNKEISKWVNNINLYSTKELELFSKIKPDLIISDISPMPLIAAKKFEVPSIAISNFSWYDVLKFLPREILEKLKISYNNADLAIKLPLGTEMAHFRNRKTVGIVSRNISKNKKQIKQELDVKNTTRIVLFALGGSDHVLKCKKGNNIEFITLNTKINSKIKTLPIHNVYDAQNYVSMADLVVGKCGYGFISECLTNGTPFFYVASDSHAEQMGIDADLVKRGFSSRKTLEEIDKMKFDSEFLDNIKKPTKVKNNLESLIKYVKEFF